MRLVNYKIISIIFLVTALKIFYSCVWNPPFLTPESLGKAFFERFKKINEEELVKVYSNNFNEEIDFKENIKRLYPFIMTEKEYIEFKGNPQYQTLFSYKKYEKYLEEVEEDFVELMRRFSDDVEQLVLISNKNELYEKLSEEMRMIFLNRFSSRNDLLATRNKEQKLRATMLFILSEEIKDAKLISFDLGESNEGYYDECSVKYYIYDEIGTLKIFKRIVFINKRWKILDLK